CTALFDCW
nr:immunoglobulin heavy chain junction region [Mus musculus]